MEQTNKGLSGNQLKLFAMLAMTVDHFTSVIWPDYPRDWWILLLHIIGRMAAPIFWFMVAEGYHYTRDLKKYAGRLLIFAVIGHFAYNFAFGIPFVPLKTGVFNQTSVMWPLFLGVVGLYTVERPELKQWQKTLAVVALTLLAFLGDWSSIAVLAILEIGQNRGDFRRPDDAHDALGLDVRAGLRALHRPRLRYTSALRRADHSAAQALQRHARRGPGHEVSFLSLLPAHLLPPAALSASCSTATSA